jgi:rod shape determining protein RodA
MTLRESNWPHANAVTFEWQVVVLGLILSAIGVCLIYSATAPLGDAGRSFVMRQITWCSLGLVIMASFLLFDYHVLERWAVWLYVGIVIALIAVWAVGKVTSGSRRWIELGLMRFQPSEFAKLAVVVILARYYQARAGARGGGALDLIQPLLLAAIPVVLVLIQPDLGTAGVIFLISISMILFAGVDRRVLAWTGGVLLALVPLGLLLGDRLLMEYQKKRILTFVNPSFDPLGAGYHIIQSQIAIGSGGISGKGFLQGTQNQLMFLPVKHTDFIFSILAEEWGFIGCAAVLILFAAFLMRGVSVAGRARDSFGALVAFGCTVSIFWHVFINVGMVMGLMPVVGVPLSFVSYGGSSLLVSYLAVAILANVSMRRFLY